MLIGTDIAVHSENCTACTIPCLQLFYRKKPTPLKSHRSIAGGGGRDEIGAAEDGRHAQETHCHVLCMCV